MRQASLAFLVTVWQTKADAIQNRDGSNDSFAESIMSVLKRGCRDNFKSVAFMAIALSFALLEQFASERNMFAPIIYKSLVFLLIDCYTTPDLRIEMLKHFTMLFRRN